MSEGVQYRNHMTPKQVSDILVNRKEEVTEILRLAGIDGAVSPEHIRYELAQRLNMGGLYNVPLTELMQFLQMGL